MFAPSDLALAGSGWVSINNPSAPTAMAALAIVSIRAEENLRHFVITGKILPANLRVAQIIALRFAPDEEFISLTEKASLENLSPKQIKSNIKNWKADLYRV